MIAFLLKVNISSVCACVRACVRVCVCVCVCEIYINKFLLKTFTVRFFNSIQY